MQQLTRLLRYVAPYWWQLVSSVLLMAAVGLLDAFRVLLIGPIFDRVLNPGSPSRQMQLFKLPISGNVIYLQQFVPSHFQNPWTVVAFALVAATILKGILDYAGTYLVNYAGFGMITDLRNIFTIPSCVALQPFTKSTRPAAWFQPSSMTSNACSSPCPTYWPSSCNNSLP